MCDHQYAVTLRGGATIPLLGFGTWELKGDGGYGAICDALRTGYRHIDTATTYENEAEVGRAVRDVGVPRDDVFITTKVPSRVAGQERRTLEESLNALGMDYVDLWLVHSPPRDHVGDYTAGIGTWRELIRAQQEGLVRSIGVSNYSNRLIDELVDATGTVPEVNQIKWSPFLYSKVTLRASEDRSILLEGWSPFQFSRLHDSTLQKIAVIHGVSPAQIVLRWHIQHRVAVIPRSTNHTRILSNFEIFHFSLSDEEMRRLDGLSGSE